MSKYVLNGKSSSTTDILKINTSHINGVLWSQFHFISETYFVNKYYLREKHCLGPQTNL